MRELEHFLSEPLRQHRVLGAVVVRGKGGELDELARPEQQADDTIVTVGSHILTTYRNALDVIGRNFPPSESDQVPRSCDNQ